MLHREPANMCLVDDRVGPWDIRWAVCLPIEMIVNHHALRDIRGGVEFVERQIVVTDVAENGWIQREGTVDRPCIWVQEEFVGIPSLARFGVPGAVDAKAVPRADGHIFDDAVEDVEVAFHQRGAVLVAGLIEVAELHVRGSARPNGHMDAAMSIGADSEGIPYGAHNHRRMLLIAHYAGRVEATAEFVSVDIHERVATIRIDRPPMNALSLQVQAEIRAAAAAVSANAEVGAVVLFGGPKIFAAGADVKEMAAMSYQEMVVKSAALQDAFTAVARIPKPTIAAITGYALGGGLELALCCDFRVAGDNVRVGQPEILLGIIPGAGGTQRLARLVGVSRAKDMIFSGRFVDAAEAAAIGLVDRVVAPDDVETAAHAWAASLARGPALALRAAKESIDADVDLGTGLGIERLAFMSLFATEDRAIGMQSFIEHGPGKAEFTGR